MKKLLVCIFFIFTLALLPACNSVDKNCNSAADDYPTVEDTPSVEEKPVEKPYSIKSGAYEFKTAAITDLYKKVTLEKSFDDIINDSATFKDWGNLFDFSVWIDENTEYFFKSDNRCFVINEGLAYELVGKNKLKLHFPRWRGNDYNFYDIVIILGRGAAYC